MAQLSFAMDKPAIAARQRQNVVPFDLRRRASRRRADVAQPVLSERVVLRLPLSNAGNRQSVSRTIADGRAEPSGSNELRFTSFDFVATAFLILSVFTAPALVWTLLRSASLG